MKNEHDTRTILINEGLKALTTCGYEGVGLNGILGAAGVPKGSFYYFFKSKEDFVTQVLAAYERHYVELRNTMLVDRTLTPMIRLSAYFDELERIHLAEAPLGGCLYGVLSQTVSLRSPAFCERLSEVFATWDEQLETLLREAQAAGEVDKALDPKEAAAFLIEAYEGALIRMKVDGGAAAFDRFRSFALGSLRLRQ